MNFLIGSQACHTLAITGELVPFPCDERIPARDELLFVVKSMRVWRFCNILNMMRKEQYANKAYWRMMDWLVYLFNCCVKSDQYYMKYDIVFGSHELMRIA